MRFINPETMAKPPGFTHVIEVTERKTIGSCLLRLRVIVDSGHD